MKFTSLGELVWKLKVMSFQGSTSPLSLRILFLTAMSIKLSPSLPFFWTTYSIPPAGGHAICRLFIAVSGCIVFLLC